MEAHLAPKKSVQVNKITYSCKICNAPHDTQYCMENLEQAFVDYASSCIDEAGGKWYTFKPEQNNLGDTYNSSWKSHSNLRWKQPQNSQNNVSNPPNRFQPNDSFLNCSFNKNPQNFNNQSNVKGLVSNFMTSQDARLSKFEANFKQQQGEMTNKIDTVLKAITDQIMGALPSDMVKNLKLNVNFTSPVSPAHSYLVKDPQCSTRIHSSINDITIYPKQPSKPHDDRPGEKEISKTGAMDKDHHAIVKVESELPQSSDTEYVCTKGDDGDIMFIEIIKKYDDSREEELREDGNAATGGPKVEYFNTFLTRSELAYHKKRTYEMLQSTLRNRGGQGNEEGVEAGVFYTMKNLLNIVLEGLKSYNNDVKYGYVQRELTNDEVEYLKLFEEEIEVRLKYCNQMRRWEMYVNGRPLGPRRERPE
ncbi:hypothetical protein Tco_1115918 [Tanacetum coccineum]